MVSPKKMRNDKPNTKKIIYHFYDLMFFTDLEKWFYAISRARVVIRSGSSILHKFGNKCQTTEKNLEVINTTFMPLFLSNFE